MGWLFGVLITLDGRSADGWVDRQLPQYLVGVDAVVDGPGGLEVLQHALLELLRQAVHADEVLQVLGARVVQRPARVQALDYRCYVTKHQSVHQRCERERRGGERERGRARGGEEGVGERGREREGGGERLLVPHSC